MAGGNLLLIEKLLRFLGKIEKTERIGYRGTALRHRLSHLSLSHGAALHEAAIPVSLFDGIQVASLNVLDQSQFQGLIVVGLLNTNRNLLQPCGLRSLPTTLTGNDLIGSVGHLAYQNRL